MLPARAAARRATGRTARRYFSADIFVKKEHNVKTEGGFGIYIKLPTDTIH